MSEVDSDALGWAAIDAALEPLYGAQEPLHWGAAPHWAVGGNNPLDGISVYQAPDPHHWHFVSYGMSDLYAKESENPELSGWGFEFTLRLKRYAEAEPPAWALSFLNNLARYVFQTGNVFGIGHHMDLNGPIALGLETAIRAIMFAEDVQLGSIATPHGRVTFLQVLGLTLEEYDAVQAWDAEKFLHLLSARDPLLVTDLYRTTWLRDSEFAREVEAGSRRDGSSQHVSFVAKAEWEVGIGARVTIGANAARSLLRLLPQRLPFGRSFALASSKQTIRFDPSAVPGWRGEDDAFVVALPEAYCRRFCEGLSIQRGSYHWDDLPGLEVTVVPSEIKDRDGKVVEVVG
jgi:suppressor of fused-like protein